MWGVLQSMPVGQTDQLIAQSESCMIPTITRHKLRACLGPGVRASVRLGQGSSFLFAVVSLPASVLGSVRSTWEGNVMRNVDALDVRCHPMGDS